MQSLCGGRRQGRGPTPPLSGEWGGVGPGDPGALEGPGRDCTSVLGHAGFQPQPCHRSQLTGCDPLPVPGLLGTGWAPWGPPGPRSGDQECGGTHREMWGQLSVGRGGLQAWEGKRGGERRKSPGVLPRGAPGLSQLNSSLPDRSLLLPVGRPPLACLHAQLDWPLFSPGEKSPG